MKKISCWAKRNVVAARILLVVLKVVLAFLGFVLGRQLLHAGIILPNETAWIFALLLMIIVIVYPRKAEKRQNSYLFRKSCDFIMAAGSFVCIATISNNNFFEQGSTVNASTALPVVPVKSPTAAEIIASLQYRDKSTLTRKEKRILKQEFKSQMKNYVVAKLSNKKRDANDALLIMLTIIGALGVLYLVAALACSLSCNGADAAAVVVVILGVAAVVWGTIAVINKITRKHNRRWEK